MDGSEGDGGRAAVLLKAVQIPEDPTDRKVKQGLLGRSRRNQGEERTRMREYLTSCRQS